MSGLKIIKQDQVLFKRRFLILSVSVDDLCGITFKFIWEKLFSHSLEKISTVWNIPCICLTLSGIICGDCNKSLNAQVTLNSSHLMWTFEYIVNSFLSKQVNPFLVVQQPTTLVTSPSQKQFVFCMCILLWVGSSKIFSLYPVYKWRPFLF